MNRTNTGPEEICPDCGGADTFTHAEMLVCRNCDKALMEADRAEVTDGTSHPEDTVLQDTLIVGGLKAQMYAPAHVKFRWKR